MIKTIAYTYEADVHCIECTRRDADVGLLKRTPPLQMGADENGLPYDLVDREGNAVHPVFSIDEWEGDMVCGDCLTVIREGQ